jgi:hypothetical protein
MELEVGDDHENADDPEWWADAAAGAVKEYGAVKVVYDLGPTGSTEGRDDRWRRLDRAADLRAAHEAGEHTTSWDGCPDCAGVV